jgi:hypothetical protein
MPKVHDDWRVLPHGPLEEVDDGILAVVGELTMPLGNFPRRMTVVRLAGGGTAIFSAIALEEPLMARIEAMGRPIVLIVPSGFHRMDAPAWKRRHPDLRVLAPPGARKRVEKVVPVDATDDVLDDPEVHFLTMPGTGGRESALEVRRGGRLTIIVNDVIGNVEKPKGFGGKLVAGLVGYWAPPPKVPRTIRVAFVKDKAALAAQFRAWAEMPGLARVIMSHGAIIEHRAKAALEELAESLAA